MALVTNRLSDALQRKARSKLGIRFGRFTIAAIAAFTTTELVLTICAGPLQLSATSASLIAWFSGALVSYVLKLSHVCPLENDLLFERFLDPNRN